MAKTSHRLSQKDWIEAGFRALAAAGPAALKAEPLARSLGTSKGSFYWHFQDLAAFQAAMLDHWHQVATHEVIARTSSPGADPAQRLRQLMAEASSAPAVVGGAAIEPAIRDWAHHNAQVAARLAEVDVARIAYIKTLISELGRPNAHRLAHLVYALHLGTEQLARSGKDVAPEVWDTLTDLLAL